MCLNRLVLVNLRSASVITRSGNLANTVSTAGGSPCAYRSSSNRGPIGSDTIRRAQPGWVRLGEACCEGLRPTRSYMAAGTSCALRKT